MKQSNNRSIALAVGGVVIAVVGLGLLLVFVFAVQTGTEGGKVEVRLGSDTFEAGSTESRARAIAQDGPILLPDPSEGTRDVFLQHLGEDPNSGWFVFDARQPDTGRDCNLVWQADDEQFLDPCDDTTVPADGTGLRHYQITVDEGTLTIDLRESTGP